MTYYAFTNANYLCAWNKSVISCSKIWYYRWFLSILTRVSHDFGWLFATRIRIRDTKIMWIRPDPDLHHCYKCNQKVMGLGNGHRIQKKVVSRFSIWGTVCEPREVNLLSPNHLVPCSRVGGEWSTGLCNDNQTFIVKMSSSFSTVKSMSKARSKYAMGSPQLVDLYDVIISFYVILLT